MENNEPMMDAVVIGTDLDGVEEAGRVLAALAGSIGDILLAACRFMADIFGGEEHGAATDG